MLNEHLHYLVAFLMVCNQDRKVEARLTALNVQFVHQVIRVHIEILLDLLHGSTSLNHVPTSDGDDEVAHHCLRRCNFLLHVVYIFTTRSIAFKIPLPASLVR